MPNMAAEEDEVSGLYERSLARRSANQTYPQMYRFIKATERHPLILIVVFKTWMKSCDAGFKFWDVFPPTGTVNALSPRCSLLTKKGKLLSSKLLPVSIHHSIMVEGWAGEDHVASELFLTHMEARGVHHVSSPVPAVFRQLSTTKMLFCFPKPALTKKKIYKPSPHFI